MRPTSRREFAKRAMVSAVGAWMARSVPIWAKNPTAPISPPLSTFPYSRVRLLDSRFRTQFEQNHQVFLHLDEDGLLKPFRQRQGMPAPGPDLGGWYDNADDFNHENNFHGFIAGHSFGNTCRDWRAPTRLRVRSLRRQKFIGWCGPLPKPSSQLESFTLIIGCPAIPSTKPAVA